MNRSNRIAFTVHSGSLFLAFASLASTELFML